jgi:Na+-translocating ferredoxin:NAD+ oxidoreductase RnfE subunit
VEVVGPIIAIAIAVVFALVCRGMAKSRNRSQNLWTVLGFFFPLISLIVLLIMGNDDSKAASA